MFNAEELARFIVAGRLGDGQRIRVAGGAAAHRLERAELAERVRALIVTRGAAGSSIHTREGELVIAAAPVREVVDPTGCGDAYRAGLIHGLLHGLDWPSTGRIASLMGAMKIESRGTQNHRFTHAEFAARLATAFG